MFTTDSSTPGHGPLTVLESGRMAQLAPVASAAPVLGVLESEVAWAAGLFEGEGSIGLRQNGTVLLSLSSTDKDVIDRFQGVIGTGQIGSQAPGRNNRKKRIWTVSVIRVADVLRIIEMFYPWLGSRRRARADEAFETIVARIEAATAERSCAFCGRSFRPMLTPNAARTRVCRRLCERRWHQKRRLTNRGQERIS